MVEMTNVPVALFNVTDWGRDAIGWAHTSREAEETDDPHRPVGAGMAGIVGSCIGGGRRRGEGEKRWQWWRIHANMYKEDREDEGDTEWESGVE